MEMGFFSNVVFPRFYDCVMDKPHWAKHRLKQLAEVQGEILEIGVGTGLNLPHYPKHVRRIVTVDPNPGMNKRLERRARRMSIEVDKRVIGGEELPIDDATFDCVVSTITLCSIAEVHAAMGELFRVLKPGGRFVFLEHGLCPESRVQKWQHRLNRIHGFISDGCRLDLNVDELLAEQPFTSVETENFYMEKTPKTHGYMYRGTAVK
jgi:ubiquinone/menaquinone biosynthesis C-methylase UbiE